MSEKEQFDEQAFMIEFINKFSNEVALKKAKEVNGVVTKKQKTSYDGFVQVTGDPTGLTNKLADIKRVDILNNLTPSQLSLLVPRFQIFKVLPPEKPNGRPIEIEFPINKTTTVDSILNSLEQRGTDVGLHSFEWEDTGKSIGQGGVTRKGKLVLFFQSFESLFMMRDVKGMEHKISFGDLVSTGYSHSQATDALSIAAVDANIPWPIKIIAGWSVPNDPSNILFSRDEIQAINNLSRTLTMSMVRSGINFGDDGTVTLTVDLVGRIEALMNSTKYDLFYVDDFAVGGVNSQFAQQTMQNDRKRIRDRREQLVKIKKRRTEIENTIITAQNEKTINKEDKGLEEEQNTIEGEIKSLQRKLFDIKSQTVEESWQQLLGGINSINIGDESGGRMFYVDLTKEQIDAYSRYKKIIREETQALAQIKDKDARTRKEAELVKQRRKYKRQLSELVKNSQSGESDAVFTQAKEDQIRKARNQKEYSKAVNSAIKDYENKRGKTSETNSYRINFFFFGDLMDAAMKIIHQRPQQVSVDCNLFSSGKKNPTSETEYKNARLILGSINLQDPETGKPFPYPIADIPVSLNLFQQWWQKYVVKPQKTSYSIRDFINDTLSSLVVNAISPAGLGIGNVPQGITPQIVTLDLPEGEMINRIWEERTNKRVSIDDVLKYRKIKGDTTARITKNVKEYILVYTESNAPVQHLGTNVFDTNEKYAIPHLFAGSSRGMVRKAGFKRTQIPKRLEAQIQNNKFGVKTNILLADKYDADVELFGAPLFINGTSIFLDPRSLGLGNTPAARIREQIIQESGARRGSQAKIWAEEIGIGGYYDIIQVKHRIRSGEFTTTLQTVNTVGLNIYNSSRSPVAEPENEVVDTPIDSTPKKKGVDSSG